MEAVAEHVLGYSQAAKSATYLFQGVIQRRVLRMRVILNKWYLILEVHAEDDVVGGILRIPFNNLRLITRNRIFRSTSGQSYGDTSAELTSWDVRIHKNSVLLTIDGFRSHIQV